MLAAWMLLESALPSLGNPKSCKTIFYSKQRVKETCFALKTR